MTILDELERMESNLPLALVVLQQNQFLLDPQRNIGTVV